MGTLKDLTGQRFGRLVVVGRAGSDKHYHTKWKCRCDCGKETIVQGTSLESGNTKSCSCLKDETAKITRTIHGKSTSRLHKVWAGMKERCSNPQNNRYHQYGGRGITVCDDWKNNFQAFYDWAMANGYDENAPRGQCTIDRIDNDKGYCPDNCRWVNMKIQRHNQRNAKGDYK